MGAEAMDNYSSGQSLLMQIFKEEGVRFLNLILKLIYKVNLIYYNVVGIRVPSHLSHTLEEINTLVLNSICFFQN